MIDILTIILNQFGSVKKFYMGKGSSFKTDEKWWIRSSGRKYDWNQQSLNFILMHSQVHIISPNALLVIDHLLGVMVHCGGSDKHDRL